MLRLLLTTRPAHLLSTTHPSAPFQPQLLLLTLTSTSRCHDPAWCYEDQGGRIKATSQEKTMPISPYNMYFHNVSLFMRHFPSFELRRRPGELGKVCDDSQFTDGTAEAHCLTAGVGTLG